MKSFQLCHSWFSRIFISLIVFFGIFIVVIVVLPFQKNEDNENSGNQTRKNLVAFGLPCISNQEGLTCSQISINELCDSIPDSKAPQTNLILQSIQFNDAQIQKGWLQCTKVPSLNHLTISSSDLNSAEAAFSGTPLSSLKTLTLDRNSLTDFQKTIFTSSKINTLEITCTNFANYERNIFEEIAPTLNTLQLQNCIQQSQNENVLATIFGPNTILSTLNLLDLRTNQLRMIRANSFTGAPNLERLYLSNSKIEAIEANSFTLQRLVILDLSNNNIKKLPEGIFHSGISGISVFENQLQCDCELVWLKEMFENPLSFEQFQDSTFYCTTKSQILPYTDVDFCSENTTIPPETEPNDIEIICNEKINDKINGITIDTIKVRQSSVSFRIIQNGSFYIQIDGNVNDDDIIWYDFQRYNQIGCGHLKSGTTFMLPYLDSNISYIFCLKSINEDTVSPFDCGALKLDPSLTNLNDDDDDIWISRSDMLPFLCGICGTFLVSMFVGGMITFFLIRSHPNLLKGNKRVIVVENETTDAIILPQNYNKQHYHQSLRSLGNGYLTPKHLLYRDQTLNTISERLSKNSHHNQRNDEHFYEPPPLPPNHPIRK